MAARFAEMIVRLRWLWVVAGLAMVGALGYGAKDLRLDPDARIFFDEANPDRIALDAFEAAFAKDDNLLMVLVPEGGAVFEPDVLAAIGDLTERAWLLPHVRRVDSITNFQHTFADGDEMIVRDLVPEPAAVSAEAAAAAREVALDRPSILHALVNPATDVTAVQVMFRLPGIDPVTETPQIMAETRALAEAFRAENPGLGLHLTGSVPMNQQFADSGQGDGMTLTPAMFVVILAVVFAAFRSVLGLVSGIVVIAGSAVAGIGALGWSGVALNSVTVIAPLIIMTLAVASVVHVLIAVRKAMPRSEDRADWAREALAKHAGAIAIACITTAIGFLALNFSISPPFRQLGNVVAVGVIAALVLTLTLLPALLVILPLRRKAEPPAASRWMERLAEFVIARRKVLLVGGGLVIAALAAGIPKLVLEDDFVRYFDERYEFRRDTDLYEARLGGLNALEWALPAPGENGISDPDYLKDVEAFAAFLRGLEDVRYVRTLTDTIARLNMNMNADDPAFHRLPETAEANAQFLFLYELSLGYGMDLTDQIDVGRSKLRVTATMANVTTTQMDAVSDAARDWLAANAPEMAVTPTGLTHVFNRISERDVKAMLGGTVLALVAISMLLLVILRDVRLGLISLIPNLVPAAMAFGIWGYTAGAVTLAIAVVLAMTLGIVVDDTVHLLSSYKDGRRRGMGPEDAVRHAFARVGTALVVTTLALVAGFAVLGTSGFAVNGDLAKLTAITITCALAADLLVLPPLLIALDRKETVMPAKAATAALIAALAVLALPTDARADAAKGLAVVQEAERRDTGWRDFTSRGEMVLRDPRGAESRRVFDGMNLERGTGEGDWSIIVFESPRDIRGTATLTHSKIEPADDDQWLYLPAVKRVKRISSSNRTGKFVGSEFSYEDLGSQEVDDNTYAYLRAEPCPGQPSLNCHVVEGYPKNARSGYSKRTSWIDDQHFRTWKVDFHNRRGDLEKTLTYSGYRPYGQFWRADRLDMANHQTGKSTALNFSNYAFGTGMGAGDFNAQRLPRLVR